MLLSRAVFVLVASERLKDFIRDVVLNDILLGLFPLLKFVLLWYVL